MMSKRPFFLGLTGSIGMGKSTTAQMFRDEGIPVWDADAAVHALYAKGGAGVAAIAALEPEAINEGQVDRGFLRNWILRDTKALKKIENAIHPLVLADREAFLESVQKNGQAIAVLDIPLLFETGADKWLDAVLVVTAPEALQRERVLARESMTEKQFEAMLAKQMPDQEKRAKADFVIETITLDATRSEVQSLLHSLRKRVENA